MNVDLDRLREERLRSIDTKENSIPFLRRGIRRYKQLSTTNSQWKVFGYFLERFFSRGRSAIASRLMKLRSWSRRGGGWLLGGDREDALTYAIRITGGLGDALIIARLARDLQAELGPVPFDVYFQSPETVEPFFRAIPGFRGCTDIDAFPAAVAQYSFVLLANQFVTFSKEHLKSQLLSRKAPKVLELVAHTERARKSIEMYIAVHPALDGAFADIVAPQGRKRHTYLHDMIGLCYRGDALDIPVDPQLPPQLGLDVGKYITVHDGWDTKARLMSDRPMKALPQQTWKEIVAEIKAKRPDIQIVQLGGATGGDIEGVDVNLKKKLTFLQSVSVLSESLLHIDTESGLVHVAASLGVRSVVAFGPTNVDWFCYPQNVNVRPKLCGNCWWVTDSWLDVCAAGHPVPVCTSRDSISPAEIASRALEAIDLNARYVSGCEKAGSVAGAIRAF
ncbi:hypothetical protein WT26_07600 [Burkholderia cepacia]|uniref:Glycosyltransferase family 9 protein n=2 Tax=Burkholderia cepacia complex TaxID=87882 RepID=A0A1B4PPL9_BURCE|nr:MULTISPECIES: glycosyltransferase family 9 protein [Burkholderia cepacia complex]AOK15896.1 hypothetical protein WT26_07600 [Burkholderia cepacia]AOK22622.1 hypothetical protein WK67_07570 [Burkholderia ubonensis]